MRKASVLLLLTVAIYLATTGIGKQPGKAENFHSPEELEIFGQLAGAGAPADTLLPTGYNTLFAASGECVQCHGTDTAGIASVDLFGNDVNVVDDWRSTMMANSAKDPFWRAKVSHEVLLFPQHQEAIETKCTSCHAPMGHFEALHNGAGTYSIAQMLADDSLAMDGVSCLACHKQTTEQLGKLHSGELRFDTARVAYGPFNSPLESPMLEATDYRPVHSDHISDAGICAGCHTLLTQTIDNDGNITDNDFVEQATYHEWLNSEFNNTVSCQGCHMPALSKGNFYLVADFDTEPRSPFYLHELVGANTFMLNLLKDNIAQLQLPATPEQFDETIAATTDMLRNQSLFLNLNLLQRTADTAFFELRIENRAGHKFPSGYPSRRAFVEFKATNAEGDTLFISGKVDGNYELEGHDPGYEPHYQTIRAENEVQVYEMVMGDVDGDVTTVLERAHSQLKDNRLPPRGFSTTHPTYDTVRIVGMAALDPDFNHDGAGVEGSATDKLYFNLPLDGNSEAFTASASIYYQSVPPRSVAHMFGTSTPEIEQFRDMYDAADRTPFFVIGKNVYVDEYVGLEQPGGETGPQTEIRQAYWGSNTLYVLSLRKHDLSIYDLNGKLLARFIGKTADYSISLDLPTGVYLVRTVSENGEVNSSKIYLR